MRKAIIKTTLRADGKHAPGAAAHTAAFFGIMTALSFGVVAPSEAAAPQQPVLGARSAPLIKQAGLTFRDLNRNGVLDAYEDWRLSAQQRAADLVRRMTLAEKAGAMMQGILPGAEGGYDLAAVRTAVGDKHIASFFTWHVLEPAELAEAHNAVQAVAEETRLGIPLSLLADARNTFQHGKNAARAPGGFSQWPDAPALAALGDTDLARRLGDITRREHRAVGLHVILGPQADLATEPRWARVSGTFGSDPATASRLAGAYVEGLQNGRDGLKPDGMAAVVKHWVGYGAAVDGFDAHNHYGRMARVDDAALADHIRAFEGAFQANAAGVMASYALLTGASVKGQPLEPVASSFSRQLMTDLLRGAHGFKGVAIAEWFITNDCTARCIAPTADNPQGGEHLAMPWGVENLSKPQRFIKALDAGIDLFGGTEEPEQLVAAVKSGQVPEARLDASVQRILEQKFTLGLFENPYVDSTKATPLVGAENFQKEADAVQRRAQVVLENRGAMPVAPQGRRVFLHNVDARAAAAYGFTVVDDPGKADIAIVRVKTPSEPLHPHHLVGRGQAEGRLDFRDGDADYEAIKRASKHAPTIVSVHLERPAILTNVRDKAAAIIANFGASDAAVLDVITGRAKAEGRLPFELPSSMAAVEKQAPGTADDSEKPLYARGYRWTAER